LAKITFAVLANVKVFLVFEANILVGFLFGNTNAMLDLRKTRPSAIPVF
jgi:hypothetical protein